MKYLWLLPLLLVGCSREDGKHMSVMSSLLNGGNHAPLPVITADSHIYLLMGQSNMAGQFYSDPLSSFIGNPGNGIGGQLPFYLNDPHAVYVQCAVGGTYLVRWLPEGDLYQRCMSLIPDTSKVKGVFFMQGESDASQQEPGTFDPRTPDWGNQFTRMVNQMRVQLGNPNLPVVFGQLGNTTRNFPFWQDIKNQQASVCIHNVQMVTTDDQAVYDGEHFTQDGYKVIADRMARAMRALN